MENFNSLGLPERLLSSLKAMQFHSPTPIQSQTIPPALTGSDILGSAQTGTGKTAAYGIPLVAHVLAQPTNAALVLAPTRELAIQVLDTLHQLIGKHSEVKTALLIGGDSMPKQLRQLSLKPRVVVGTPGRINDHLERGTLQLNQTNFLVLDETDRMLDMGFTAQIQEIIRYMPEKRQTLMFSATMAPEIVRVANSYLQDPVRIAVGSTTTPMAAIEQEVLKAMEADKYALLLELLEKRQGTVIVFVKTKFGADKLAVRLRRDSHTVEAIHGDLRQAKRERVIREFRAGKSRVLVATDVAARGLDIPHIECVVNYDLPQCPEDYIHRIGRTGRAGAQGYAVSLVTGQDGGKWRAISKLMSTNGAASSAVKIENRMTNRPEPRPSSEPAATTADGAPAAREPREQRGEWRDRREDRGDRGGRFEFKPRFERSFSRGEGKDFGFEKRPQRDFGEGSGFRAPREERPRFGDDKPRFGGDKPRFGGDKPRFGSDRPRFGGDKPRFGDDKPRFGGGDKPRFGSDRPRFTGERPRFGDDKPRFGGDKPRFGDDKPRFNREEGRGGSRFGAREFPSSPFGQDRKPGEGREFRPRFGERRDERSGAPRTPRGPFVDALVEQTPWQRRPQSDKPRFGFKPRFSREQSGPREQFARRPESGFKFGKKRPAEEQEAQ